VYFVVTRTGFLVVICFFIYLGVKTTFSGGESVVLVRCFMFLFLFVFISFCLICPIASFVQKRNIVNIKACSISYSKLEEC
jgi:hypothetical protein